MLTLVAFKLLYRVILHGMVRGRCIPITALGIVLHACRCAIEKHPSAAERISMLRKHASATQLPCCRWQLLLLLLPMQHLSTRTPAVRRRTLAIQIIYDGTIQTICAFLADDGLCFVTRQLWVSFGCLHPYFDFDKRTENYQTTIVF